MNGHAFVTVDGCCSCLRRCLPAGINKCIQFLFVLKNKNCFEFLHPEAQTRLNLDHFHEGFPLRGFIDNHAVARTTAGKKDFHANVVRAALGVEHGEFGNYMKDKKFAKEKIYAVIDGAIKNNIYVIVDWHSHNINLNEAKEFFDEVSLKYGNFWVNILDNFLY